MAGKLYHWLVRSSRDTIFTTRNKFHFLPSNPLNFLFEKNPVRLFLRAIPSYFFWKPFKSLSLDRIYSFFLSSKNKLRICRVSHNYVALNKFFRLQRSLFKGSQFEFDPSKLLFQTTKLYRTRVEQHRQRSTMA